MVHTLFVIGCKLRYHFERAEILEGQIACSKPQDLNNVGICCSFLQFVSVLCHPSKVNKSVSPPFLESKRERFNNCWWRAFESFTICGLELFSPKSERQGCQQLQRAWSRESQPETLCLARQAACHILSGWRKALDLPLNSAVKRETISGNTFLVLDVGLGSEENIPNLPCALSNKMSCLEATSE